MTLRIGRSLSSEPYSTSSQPRRDFSARTGRARRPRLRRPESCAAIVPDEPRAVARASRRIRCSRGFRHRPPLTASARERRRGLARLQIAWELRVKQACRARVPLRMLALVGALGGRGSRRYAASTRRPASPLSSRDRAVSTAIAGSSSRLRPPARRNLGRLASVSRPPWARARRVDRARSSLSPSSHSMRCRDRKDARWARAGVSLVRSLLPHAESIPDARDSLRRCSRLRRKSTTRLARQAAPAILRLGAHRRERDRSRESRRLRMAPTEALSAKPPVGHVRRDAPGHAFRSGPGSIGDLPSAP